jgi:hypothetical protein
MVPLGPIKKFNFCSFCPKPGSAGTKERSGSDGIHEGSTFLHEQKNEVKNEVKTDRVCTALSRTTNSLHSPQHLLIKILTLGTIVYNETDCLRQNFLTDGPGVQEQAS